jgi:hypothetical protein
MNAHVIIRSPYLSAKQATSQILIDELNNERRNIKLACHVTFVENDYRLNET